MEGSIGDIMCWNVDIQEAMEKTLGRPACIFCLLVASLHFFLGTF